MRFALKQPRNWARGVDTEVEGLVQGGFDSQCCRINQSSQELRNGILQIIVTSLQSLFIFRFSQSKNLNKISPGTTELEIGLWPQPEAEPCLGASGPLVGKRDSHNHCEISRLQDADRKNYSRLRTINLTPYHHNKIQYKDFHEDLTQHPRMYT